MSPAWPRKATVSASIPSYVMGSSISAWTFMQHGLVGAVLVGEIQRSVGFGRKAHVAEHRRATRALAFDVHLKLAALVLPLEDGAQSEDGRFDVLGGDLDPHGATVGVGAGGVLGI